MDQINLKGYERIQKITRLRSLEGQMRSFPAKYTEIIA